MVSERVQILKIVKTVKASNKMNKSRNFLAVIEDLININFEE